VADLSIDSALSGSVGSTISGSFGAVGPVTLGGIPSNYTFNIKELPKIEVGLDPVEGRLTLDPVTVKLEPIETNLSIKEIPSVRVHLPANYALAFSIFGVEIAALQLCGEGQVITEPYEPSPCEVCGGQQRGAAMLAQLSARAE